MLCESLFFYYVVCHTPYGVPYGQESYCYDGDEYKQYVECADADRIGIDDVCALLIAEPD